MTTESTLRLIGRSTVFPSLGLALVTYLVGSWTLFEDSLWPLGFMLVWHDRLPIQYWIVPVAVGVLVGGATAKWVWSLAGGRLFALSVFVAISVSMPVLLTIVTVDHARKKLVAAFEPDRVFQNSLWQSFRNAPREHQFFLHAAALKSCIPYAWSYRKMTFYRLPKNVAINVLPDQWLEDCSLRLD